MNLKILLLYLPLQIHSSLQDLVIGYDCSLGRSNVTSFALNDVKPCLEVKHNITTKDVYIQLIQPRVIRKIKVKMCSVQMMHLVTRCGKTWFQSYEGGLYSEVPELSSYECYDMIRSRRYQIPMSSKMVLLSGQKTVWRGETIGSNPDGGDCTPGIGFSHDQNHFDKPIRTTEAIITTYEEEVEMDVNSGKLIFSDGSRCRYLDGKCFTNQKGYAFWDLFHDVKGCFDNANLWQVLYQGRATKISEFSDGIKPYISYVFTVNQHDISIGYKDESRQCGLIIVQTEHPKLQVLELIQSEDGYRNENAFPIKITDILPQDTNIMLYFNHKMVFMMRHVRIQIDELYRKIQQDRCRVEQIALRNELAIGYMSPQLFAVNYFKEPGYTAIRSGEVIHVAKCKRVSVRVRNVDRCYDELPVTHRNMSMFLSPVTRILTRVGTEVECNPAFGIMYELGGIWYLIGKMLQPVQAPQYLAPNDDNVNWHFKDIGGLATGGIYTEENLDSVQHMFIGPMEREALGNVLISKMRLDKDGVQDISIVHALSDGDYDIISQKLSGWISKFLHSLGIMKEWVLDVMVVVFIWTVIKMIISKIFDLKMVSNEGYGCLGYIAACFGSPLRYLWKKQSNKKMEELHEIIDATERSLLENLKSVDAKIVIPSSHRREWVVPTNFEPIVST